MGEKKLRDKPSIFWLFKCGMATASFLFISISGRKGNVCVVQWRYAIEIKLDFTGLTLWNSADFVSGSTESHFFSELLWEAGTGEDFPIET